MLIAASGRIVDGSGDLEPVHSLENRLRTAGLRVREVYTASLKMGWQTGLPENYLFGACSPMQAVLMARSLFDCDQADALILRGEDRLMSDYTKEERQRLMQCYVRGQTHLDGYLKLAEYFAIHRGIPKDEFHTIAESLFSNYARTANRRCIRYPEPGAKWFGYINEYFRGVDCANPYIDFSGAIVVLTTSAADLCEVPDESRTHVLGTQLREVGADGLEYIRRVAAYDHLEEVYRDTCDQAATDFSSEFLAGQALLEVYTCYPVVPMAFLLTTGLVANASEIPSFLEEYEITVTGGLNLSRAPWNNTTLNNIIAMIEVLGQDHSIKLAGIHGNGSLGYQQGFMVLRSGC